MHAPTTKVTTMKTKPSTQQLQLRKVITSKQELSLLTHTIRHSIDLESLITVFEDMGVTDPAVIQPLKKAAGSRLSDPLKANIADKLAAAMLGYGRTNQMFSEYKQVERLQKITVGVKLCKNDDSNLEFYAPENVDLTEADMDMMYGGGLWDVCAPESERMSILNKSVAEYPAQLTGVSGAFSLTSNDVAFFQFDFERFIILKSDFMEKVSAFPLRLEAISREYEKELRRCTIHTMPGDKLTSIKNAGSALADHLEGYEGTISTYQSEKGQLFVVAYQDISETLILVESVVTFPQEMKSDKRFSSCFSA